MPTRNSWRSVSVLVAFGLCLGATRGHAQAPAVRHVKASLVAETDAVRPGQPLTVGIRLEMEKGWHTYWRNPGDSGLPTRVRWTLPAGFSAGELRWPYPQRFAIDRPERVRGLVLLGYPLHPPGQPVAHQPPRWRTSACQAVHAPTAANMTTAGVAPCARWKMGTRS